MAFIPLPNGIKVCMRFRQAEQNTCNVFYVTATGTVDLTLLDGIGDTLKAWYVANIQPWQNTNVSLEAIEITDVSVSGGLGIEYTTGLPLLGANVGGAMPNNVTVAVKLGTGLTGRSHRGRQYFVGLPEAYLAGSKQAISTTFQTTLKGAYDALISDLVAYGVELVIASFFSGGVPRTTGVTTPVSSVSVNPTLDSQRRRLPERGS